MADWSGNAMAFQSFSRAFRPVMASTYAFGPRSIPQDEAANRAGQTMVHLERRRVG